MVLIRRDGAMMTDKIDKLFRKIERAKPFIYRIDGQYYFYSNGVFRQCTDVEIKKYAVYQKHLGRICTEAKGDDPWEKYCILREIAFQYRKQKDFELLEVVRQIHAINCEKKEDCISLEDMKQFCIAKNEYSQLKKQTDEYDLVYKGVIPYLESRYKERAN